jgi:sphingomyelin phosphodiesterase 2
MASDTNRPPSSLRVLSLNCWGLKFISKLRNERLAEIGVQIAAASPSPDIVGLQECWTQQDYNAIREKTQHILPYGKFYHSGIFGGGLVILSRFPIIDSNMVRYPLNGRPAAFYRGDWFVGKGVACARIKIGPSPRDIAEVFTTHVRTHTRVYSSEDMLIRGSSTPPTNASHTTPTSVIAQPKHGRLQNSCAPLPNVAISS